MPHVHNERFLDFARNDKEANRIPAERKVLNEHGAGSARRTPVHSFSALSETIPTPVKPRRQVRSAKTPVDSPELKALLLVDDDIQLASALQWILADEKFLVDLASDGEEAMRKVKTHRYDAVICDLMMPRVTGDEFYLNAKKLRPTLSDRFIFMTGFPGDPKIKSFLARHDVKYLIKPFPVGGLIHCVRELFS